MVIGRVARSLTVEREAIVSVEWNVVDSKETILIVLYIK
jgi:hypothetical protein